ncbi:hypothetical protein DYH09_07525 [bacterium CPR1]|nr:hypothetical protein [bacterium CPR1]
MKASRFALVCLILSLTLAFSCSSSAAPPLANVEFQGQEQIPRRVENLRGTALLGLDEADLPAEIKSPDASFFVMLSPTQVDQGILVKAPLSSEKLKQLDSAKLNVSGDVTTVDDPAMVARFKQKYGFQLKTSPEGKVQMIVHEGPLELPPASPEPAASEEPPATPAPTASEEG